MEIFSMDRHDYDYNEDDTDFVNCSPPYRGLNLITHALEWVNANNLPSQAVEIDSEPMSNKNEVIDGDLEPREVFNDSAEVLEKQDRGVILAGLASFDPPSIIEYVRVLGQSVNGGVDESEVEVAKAQLVVFSSWRGHSQLPEFSALCGNLRCDADAELELKGCSSEPSDDAPPGFEGYRKMHDLLGSFKDSKLSNVRIDEHVASRAACFCSTRLIEYLKGLGGSPCGEVDGSELAVAKAQLLAFANWKGYSQLPEFTLLSGYLGSDTYLGNHNMIALHTLEGQMYDWEKSNERLGGKDNCEAARFDTVLNNPLGNIANLKWVEEEYCCSDLVDDAPPGFENYRMISQGQINLNEELNRINEEEVVCTRPCFGNVKLIGYLKTLSKSPLGQFCESELIEAKLQLQDFFRWKGCSQLPEFTTAFGLLENVSQMGLPEDETCHSQINLNEELNMTNVEAAVCTKPCFDYMKLIGFLRTLSKSPLDQLCESELIEVKSHLQAFFSWKGCSQLPEFTTFFGSLQNISEMGFPKDENRHSRINLNEELNIINEEEAVYTKPCSDNMKLIGYLRTLSKSPLDQLCESEFIEAKSHLQAFFSWKGCFQPPEFTTSYGSMENVSKMRFPEHENCHGQINLNEELNITNEEEAVCTKPCFDNMKLIGYLRTLSKSPLDQLCELELIEAKSHLQAFFSWKGCSQLPKVTYGSLENGFEMGFPESCHGPLIVGSYPCFGDKDGKNDMRRNLQNPSSNLMKMKQTLDGSINFRKRKKSSSFLLGENQPQKLKEKIVGNRPCSGHMKLIGFLRTLSISPLEQLGGSELVDAKSKLQAFFRWKGCSQLPEFLTSNGSLENISEMGFPKGETCHSQLIGGSLPCFGDYDGINNARRYLQNQSSNLRETKQIFVETNNSRKRKKGSPHLLDRNRLNGSNGNWEPMSSLDDVKAAFSRSDIPAIDSTREELLISSDKFLEFQQIGVGNKVASKLNAVALEHLGECDYGISGKKRTVESSVNAHRSSKSRRMLIRGYTCSEMLSELLFTATVPLERLNLSVPVVSFFSQFKDSIASGSSSLMGPIKSPEHVSISETPSTLKSSESVESAGHLFPKDSCSSDYLVDKIPEQQLTRTNQDAWNILLQVSREEAYPSSEQQISPKLSANMASVPDNRPGNSGAEAKETIDDVEEEITEANYQTALVLTFINNAAVPSEGYLNKVFGCFGQLNEQETKVFNKRNGCRVVYRKRADAEAAFTSVGKHGIFRDTLLSYRLKYVHSKPTKAPIRARRRNSDSASCTLGAIQSSVTLVDL